MNPIKLAFAGALCALPFTAAARADDFKKDYCGNKDYVTDGNKYPHIHCAKDFMVYSASKSDHKDLGRGATISCERTKATIDTVKALEHATGKAEMTEAATALARVHCKKKDGN